MIHRISRPLFLSALLVFCLAPLASAQNGGRYENSRSLVERVQMDLKHAADFVPTGNKERERFENVQKHLSEFDRELVKYKFDRDKLDTAIDDLKNVVEHNTLSSEDRDALSADLRDMRDLRASRGRAY